VTAASPEPAVPANRIIVGYDSSDSSKEALRWAVSQAALTGDVVEVIATWTWPTSYGWTMAFPTDYDPAADAQTAIDQAVGPLQAEAPGVRFETRVVEGAPAATLVEASHGADLLVVGSRGHGAFAGMLLGSVSDHCVSHAHCPVLVHRPRS